MFRPSLTKNWPGGRRHATVIQPVPFEGSALAWNTKTAAFSRPYWPTSAEQQADISPDMKAALREPEQD